jgi:hypothetical protein
LVGVDRLMDERRTDESRAVLYSLGMLGFVS